MVTSSLSTSATRRSRTLLAAVSTATRAAAAHDSLLVPMTWVTRYTLSVMSAPLSSAGTRAALPKESPSTSLRPPVVHRINRAKLGHAQRTHVGASDGVRPERPMDRWRYPPRLAYQSSDGGSRSSFPQR